MAREKRDGGGRIDEWRGEGAGGRTKGRFSCMRVVLIFIILFCFRS